MGHSQPLFVYFRFLTFQTNITIFCNKTCEKMFIQYTTLGFEPQPSEQESPLKTTTSPNGASLSREILPWPKLTKLPI